MPIYLTEQYAKAVEKLYTHTSFLRPHCKAHVDMIGKKTCKVYQILTSELNDYKREGKDRYGVPNDVQDIVNEYTITQDKAFTAIVDKGDGSQQAISNKAGQYLRQQISEKCVPTGDKYGFSRIARFGHIQGVTAAPTKSDIISTIYDAAAYMDDHYVPDDGRILFVRVSDYKKIIISDEWVKLDNLAGKQLPTGVVGQVAGFTVVKVPDRLFPTDVYMLAIHEQALAFPYVEALRSPATIMKLAREQGALCEIERLTFFKSLGSCLADWLWLSLLPVPPAQAAKDSAMAAERTAARHFPAIFLYFSIMSSWVLRLHTIHSNLVWFYL